MQGKTFQAQVELELKHKNVYGHFQLLLTLIETARVAQFVNQVEFEL